MVDQRVVAGGRCDRHPVPRGPGDGRRCGSLSFGQTTTDQSYEMLPELLTTQKIEIKVYGMVKVGEKEHYLINQVVKGRLVFAFLIVPVTFVDKKDTVWHGQDRKND